MITIPSIVPTMIKNVYDLFTSSDNLNYSDINIVFIIFMCLTFVGISIVVISLVLTIFKKSYEYAYRKYSFVRNFNEDVFLDKAISRSIVFLLILTAFIPIFSTMFFLL